MSKALARVCTREMERKLGAAGFGQRNAPGMPGTGLKLLSRFTSKLRCLESSGVARTVPDSE
jgi:hypothetical protein